MRVSDRGLRMRSTGYTNIAYVLWMRQKTTGRMDKMKKIRSITAAVLTILLLLTAAVADTAFSLTVLPCDPGQGVTPFRDGILYYDGLNICHVSCTGTLRWSYGAGENMKYTAGPAYIAIWSGNELILLDQNGNAVYNGTQEETIQFVRVGEQFAAVVTGDDTQPKLIVRNMKGGLEDNFGDTYDGMMLMDVGFFGDEGQYLWTLALDMYGTNPNMVMNTYQVGKMNYGQVSLGDDIAYRVIYDNSKLRVFTIQRVYTFDYRCAEDSGERILVYGWKMIDAEIPERERARILLAPEGQTSYAQAIMELRVLEGEQDIRYTLPASCVGACVYGGRIFAVSGDHLYMMDTGREKFYGYQIPGLEENEVITGYFGTTEDGMMVVSSSAGKVYGIQLPR